MCARVSVRDEPSQTRKCRLPCMNDASQVEPSGWELLLLTIKVPSGSTKVKALCCSSHSNQAGVPTAMGAVPVIGWESHPLTTVGSIRCMGGILPSTQANLNHTKR